ncbi:GNAT family N-acetyltransferase [Kitasatospora setae]|uniref:N-acetyltransferase domain-containing protein n=1 Tax=Kitasatospora setae (strain ATCC 33774 / DSM 43861 / JCM 3304 / KCC A-0304 / NBRC 14216 / KM-6054) TaxID=452652 RepID=E4NDM6_KITSK|nr:hypothetical protein KSE_35005 [Kitasatospora setae KM-6054]
MPAAESQPPVPPVPSVPSVPPVLREGGVADAAAVAALYVASRRTAYAGLVPAPVLAAEGAEQELLWTLRLDADYGTPADTPVLLLAEDAGRAGSPAGGLLGFAYLVPDGGLVRLEHLHVRPGRTGGGIGGLLLRAALDRAAGTPVRLEVLAANRRAVAFYERHGARRLGGGTARFPDGTELPEYAYGWN